MSEHDFEASSPADSEGVIPGSPARLRLDERLRATRSLRSSLRPRVRQPQSLSYESATSGLNVPPPRDPSASSLHSHD